MLSCPTLSTVKTKTGYKFLLQLLRFLLTLQWTIVYVAIIIQNYLRNTFVYSKVFSYSILDKKIIQGLERIKEPWDLSGYVREPMAKLITKSEKYVEQNLQLRTCLVVAKSRLGTAATTEAWTMSLCPEKERIRLVPSYEVIAII